MITTLSYYHSDIRLANINSTAPNESTGNKLLFEKYGEKYEREALIKVLGYSLYKLFKDDAVLDISTGQWNVTAMGTTKYQELMTGKEYTINGKSMWWKGLVFDDTDASVLDRDRSLLAYYVYSKIITLENYSHSGVGLQAEGAKNATRVHPREKWAFAYNEFVRLTQGEGNNVRGLYEFISDMNTLDPTYYPEWDGENVDYVNRYGL